MIKPGFSLVEFLIASLIAGMVSATLFAMIAQINKVVNRVDTVAEMYTNALLIHNQFEWDLSGAFVPQLGQPVDESAEKKSLESKEAGEKQGDEKKIEQKKESAGGKRLSKVFYGVGTDKNFELTFITSNPLQVYWSADVGRAKPRVARVRYFVAENKEKPGVFSFMRQESYDLDAAVMGRKGDAPDKVRAYVLAEHVKEIKAEYVLRKEKKSEGEKSASGVASEGAKAKAPEFEYVLLKEWNSDKASDDENVKLAQAAIVPHSVRFTYAIWDIRQKRFEQFSCIVPIVADSKPIKEHGKKPSAQQKPGNKSAGMPGLPGQPGQSSQSGKTYVAGSFFDRNPHLDPKNKSQNAGMFRERSVTVGRT